MELTYTKVGDYSIPDLTLGDDADCEIGVYGRMRERFLEDHHHGTYTSLLLTGELWMPVDLLLADKLFYQP